MIDIEKVKSVLKNGTSIDLTEDEKTFVGNYLHPEPLLDYELPSVVSNYQRKIVDDIDPGFLSILVRALKTRQYGKFIRHLMWSFLNPESIVLLENDQQIKSCPICGKTVYGYGIWSSAFRNTKEIGERKCLGYCSTKSDLYLDLDCLAHLKELERVMNIIEPNFLSKRS